MVCYLMFFLSFWIDDCAVIDEIQMMNDNERGWAWTRALLGLLCFFSPSFCSIPQLLLTY